MNYIEGGCSCSKVRYKISSPPLSQGVCYCRECQKTNGTYGSPMLVLSKDTFKYTSEGVPFYQTLSQRGTIVKRYFCGECGVHVFAKISDFSDVVTVKAVTLDDFSIFSPQYLVWMQSASSRDLFPSGVPLFHENAPLETLLGYRSSE